jgi:hypothetical protein
MNHARILPILIISVLAVCGTAASQEPAYRDSLISSPTSLFIPADGQSSPVDTLEQLTGERTTAPGRERRGESERDEIETDRDSFTPATTIAPRGRLIVESAYSFVDNRGFAETHSFPETISDMV